MNRTTDEATTSPSPGEGGGADDAPAAGSARHPRSPDDPSFGYPPDVFDGSELELILLASRAATDVITTGPSAGPICKNFQQLGPQVYLQTADEASAPKRAEVIALMKRIVDSASELGGLLDIALVRAYLISGYRPFHCTPIDFECDLAQMVTRALDVVATLSGPGRHRINAAAVLDLVTYPLEAHVLCALGVRVGWHLAHGKYPGDANITAHRACEAFWNGINPRAQASWGVNPSGWRKYLRAAKDLGNQRHADMSKLFAKGRGE